MNFILLFSCIESGGPKESPQKTETEAGGWFSYDPAR